MFRLELITDRLLHAAEMQQCDDLCVRGMSMEARLKKACVWLQALQGKTTQSYQISATVG